MNKMKCCTAILIIISWHMLTAQDFVTVKDGHFFQGDEPYRFIGANFWYGMYLAATGSGDRARLIKELDMLAALGVTNLRIMACGEGPREEPWRVSPPLQKSPGVYSDELLSGLDFLLSEMSKRNLKAVVCLNNFWPWTGGMAQYTAWSTDQKIPYPPPAEGGNWVKYMVFTAKFYADQAAKRFFKNHIAKIVQRTNSITGLAYRDDPTIMAWQLANEPRGMLKIKKYRQWIKTSSDYIKSLDPNHLVSIGSEGNTPSKLSGNRFMKDHAIPGIDYATIHIWVQNWMWYDPKNAERQYQEALAKARQYYHQHLEMARKLKKPLVLEEFGMARDQESYDPNSATIWRDKFFAEIFGWVDSSGLGLAGCNFWAWAGMGRPKFPRAIWQHGHDLIGDPPHEFQGWYSVYDHDASTLRIIKKYAQAIGL